MESSRSTSKTVARQIMEQRRAELVLGVGGVQKKCRVPLFKTAAEDWLKKKNPMTARLTGETYHYMVKSLIKHFGERLASDITANDISDLQCRRLEQGKSARTVNLEVGTLQQILRAHGFWGPIDGHIRHLKERQDVGRAIGHEDERKLLDSIRLSRSPALCRYSCSPSIPA